MVQTTRTIHRNIGKIFNIQIGTVKNFFSFFFDFYIQDAFVKIIKTEGVFSLWSGLSPTLVLALPATVVYFTAYEQLRCLMKDRQEVEKSLFYHKPVWLTSLLAGAIARTWAVTVVSPLELIRTKMQSQKLSYRGMLLYMY